jgi:DNA-binding NtrC family response regulator
MKIKCVEIILVEPDDELADMIIDHVESALDAQVTRFTTASESLAAYAERAPDIVISEMQLPDRDGLSLVREVHADPDLDSAVILLTDHPTVGRAVEAMRLGVRDMFTKPFDLRRLSHVIEQLTQEQRDRRRELRRAVRLRRVTRRIIRERRDLRQRVDLICRDIVSAYHRLATKVAETQPTGCDE